MTQSMVEQSGAKPGHTKMLNLTLWTVQALLAALFLFAGGFKLFGPLEQMMKQMPIPLSPSFIRFIGVCESLGGLGLILPGLLRIRQGLTPLAASGLVIIMTGATVYNLRAGTAPTAVFTLVLGLLAAFVAYGRWSSLRAA